MLLWRFWHHRVGEIIQAWLESVATEAEIAYEFKKCYKNDFSDRFAVDSEGDKEVLLFEVKYL